MTRTKLSTWALASCSLLALASPAFAQTAPAADGATNVGEVVVTATRREERLQDVPLAVSAVGGDQLAKAAVQNLTDVQYALPGVQFGTTPNDAGFRLRGVGSAGGFTSASEQNVGLVVDGVVVPFGNPVESLGNIERIEVLKGPQGTQFGKNASSGVISITTARPRLGEFGGGIYASYAELDEHDVHGDVNIPIGSTAALDVFLFDRSSDGFIKNTVRHEKWGDSDRQGARAKLFWQASENLDVQISGDYSRTKANSPGQLWTLNKLPPGDPAFSMPFVNLAALGVVAGPDNEVSVEEYPGMTKEKNFGAAAEINYQLGDYTLTSVTAYRGQRTGPLVYAIDASPLPRFTAVEVGTHRNFVSEELRLTSPSGEALEYVAGVYVSRNQTNNHGSSAVLRPALPFAPVAIGISAGQAYGGTVTRSAAVFFDGSYKLTEQLSLLGGLRYSHDKVNAFSASRVNPDIQVTVPYTPRAFTTGETSNGDWSGRLGLQYKPSDDVMIYGTAARGYLGPTVTFSGLTGTKTEVAPQTVKDITVGAKTQFFDRRLTLNGDIFYDKYKDLQTAVFNGLEFVTENAGGFEAKGFEIEGSYRASRRVTLTGGFTYSDAKFTDYVTACPTPITLAGAAAIAAQCNAVGSTTATPLFQAAGEQLPGAPKYTATGGVSFNQPVSNGLVVDASANVYYRSATQNSVGDSNTRMDAYTTVNLSAGIGPEDGAWRFGVFARNAFNERFNSAILGLPFASGGYVNWLTREGRRTVGLSLEAKF